MLSIVSTSSDNLELDLVKEHLVIDHQEDDDLIVSYMGASLDAAERYLNKKVRLTSYAKTLVNMDDTIVWDTPSPSGALTLEYNGGSISINKYDYNYDRDGDTNYYIYFANKSVKVVLNDKPADYDDSTFNITYTSGSSDETEAVTQARLLLIGTWYEHRASVTPKTTKVVEIPHTVGFLLDSYKEVAI